MSEGALPGTSVTVDVCAENRHGLWLDQGELEAVVASKAAAGAAGALAGFCADVFGTGKNRQNTN